MVLFRPEQCVCNQEVGYLRTTVVVDQSAPVRMCALTRILMLIYTGSVKCSQTIRITREMCRYPVKDHANALLMQIVHEIFEIIRSTITAGRCIVTGHLITPGCIQRMLHNRKQFYMSISHVLHILCQTRCDLTIIIEFRTNDRLAFLIQSMLFANPGAQMHLVDRHRLFLGIFRLSGRHPGLIGPLKLIDIPYNGCGIRTKLCIVAIRVRLQHRLALAVLNLEFINGSSFDPRQEQLKYAGITQTTHLMTSAIPVIKIANNTHTHCTRCPYGEIRTGNAVDGHRMCAHLLINLIMNTGLELLQIRLSILTWICIRIVKFCSHTTIISHDKRIIRHHLARHQNCKESGIILLLHRIL